MWKKKKARKTVRRDVDELGDMKVEWWRIPTCASTSHMRLAHTCNNRLRLLRESSLTARSKGNRSNIVIVCLYITDSRTCRVELESQII